MEQIAIINSLPITIVTPSQLDSFTKGVGIMSITIFRKMRGRVVPITVDEDHVSEYLAHEYKKTPKHKVTTSKFDSITSFTIPNASCQKCGKDVFYYENSYGSRVLFDSLGPPWPIHPCYNSEPVLKNKIPHTVTSGWEPVLIDKGIITSSGGLKIQCSMGADKIRFIFEPSDFTKIKIDLKEVTNLIVFASRDEGKVQTHNGKRTFTSRYEIVPEKSDTDSDLQQHKSNNNIIMGPTSEMETPYSVERSISKSKKSHIVGTLAIRNIELVVDESENMTAIINGSLSKRFRVTYILLEYEKCNDLLSGFNKNGDKFRIKTCLVKDTEDEITLVFKNSNGDSDKVFNVSFVKRNIAENLVRVMPAPKQQPVVKQVILHRKKRERSLQEQIDSLATKISSPMAEAFLNAKKNSP
ncbi:MAG: hypothetical protein ACRDCA_08850 [Serratia sp. (in: enterobacteria)]|uniref:hypothetical protein n=1 Tax=Serratia sp. (in: enterobacteria) TaxID=616 RepID=UPI003F3DC238